jgi:hypothetical protein
MRAIWHPFWYERDLPINMGQVGDFEFFQSPPPYVKSDGFPVFWHDGWNTEPDKGVYTKHLRILSIRHPELGQVESIETEGLEYTIAMNDGRIAKLEAEEEPGTVYFVKPDGSIDAETSWKLNDWRFYVEADEI